MTTTTVLRLKRRITDEPLKALVVSYKRPRLTELQQTDTPEFTEISAVRQEIFQLSDDSTRFKKALQSYGESSEEKNISTEPSEYIWSGTKVCRQAENVKIHLGDIKLTNRQLLAGSRQRQRDRLMKVIRSIDKSAVVDVGSTNEVRLKLDSSAAESVFAEMAGLVDAVEPSNKQEKTKDKKMEETILCNGVPMRRVANQDLESELFTYDYYVATTGFNDLQTPPNILDCIVNISAFQTDEKCEYLVEGESEESEKDSEEDSNAEDYWGNEYPDEEDLEGVDYSSEEEDFNEDRQDFLSLTSRYRNAHSEFLQQMKNLDVGGNNEEEDDDDSDLVSE